MEVEIGVNAKGMQILLDMNSQLEAEVSRLCAELNELSKGVLKRGFLYKLRWKHLKESFILRY